MEENNVLISVVVPCYNNAATIEETIDSVLCQTFNQWELICVDDGSTDETVEIIRRYCEKDNRVKLHIRDVEPKGGSHCRNIGGFAAKGKYLIFIDGDDLFTSTCFENRLKKIEGTDYKFVVFQAQRFTGSNTNNRMPGIKLNKNRDYLYYFSSGNAGWQTTAPIYRTDYFLSLNGFDQRYPRLQDIEFNLRAIAAAGRNYLIASETAIDYYLRVGYSNESSFLSKLDKALQAYKFLLDLVEEMSSQGVYTNKGQLSKAVVCIYCNAYSLYDSLAIHNKSVACPEWIKKIGKNGNICKLDLLLLNILRLTLSHPRMNQIVARSIGKFFKLLF